MVGSFYVQHRRKAFRSGNNVARLLDELAAAAVSAGGTGLANWAIWLADTSTTNQGGLSGNLTAPGGTPGTTTVGSRLWWTFNGTQYWQAPATAAFETDTQSSFCLQDPIGISATQVIWRHNYGQGTGSYAQDHGMLYDANDYVAQARDSAGVAVNNRAAGSTSARLLSMVWASDAVRGWQDGTANAAATSSATLTPTEHLNSRLGTNVGTAGVWFSGNIAMWAICTRDLQSVSSGTFGTARQRVEAAINTYYGR
jgi:hypothetical protein